MIFKSHNCLFQKFHLFFNLTTTHVLMYFYLIVILDYILTFIKINFIKQHNSFCYEKSYFYTQNIRDAFSYSPRVSYKKFTIDFHFF